MEVKSKLFKRKSGKSKGKWVIRIEYFDQLAGKKKFTERHASKRSDAGDERDRLVNEIKQTHGQIQTGERMTFNSLADICEKGFYRPAVLVEGRKIEGVRAHNTAKNHLTVLKQFFGERLIGQITTESLREYRRWRLENGSRHPSVKEGTASHLGSGLPESAAALLERIAPGGLDAVAGTFVDRAIRITASMSGGCFVIQGPLGTGKTYTAARVINSLVAAGKRVGVLSNSHKAVVNLLIACGDAVREEGGKLKGIKVGGEGEGPLYDYNPGFSYIKDSGSAIDVYSEGVVGGTAWLFARDEWENQLDFMFIDEAGQVSLANAIAVSRCAKNLVLLGDQMQLEQPVQGTHPGDAGLSGLQYALKEPEASREDLPIFHAVVPPDYGLFLGESRRMHPAVCEFISESIYEGRLRSFGDCARQRIAVPAGRGVFVSKENGIVFSGVEHEGNIQQSDEEGDRVAAIFDEMLGRSYTVSDGTTRALGLEDFLFIAPYNAQVRALQAALPEGSRVGSVDKFQGQEAPVCILSLCSSFGEYGSRGLGFILDRNRINVAISRAQCLAVVVGDPRIAGTKVGSLDEMRLLNLYCKLISAGD